MLQIELHRDADTILKNHFGLESFRRGQKEIITSILSGKDTLAVMPTGGGKSLCYQLPSLLLEGIVIVISPLIALMQDQVTSLKKLKIPSGCIHSGLPIEEKRKVFVEMKNSEHFVLLLSPERIQKQGFMEWIKTQKVSLIAIDEAHCISQWGPDFRPDYHRLADIRKIRPDIPVLALTATATPEVLTDIAVQMNMKHPDRHVYGFYRPNLYYQVEILEKEIDKPDFVYSAIIQNPIGRILIYCGTRKQSEGLYDDLKTKFEDVGYYHAGLSAEEREKIQKDYNIGKIRILAATNAFGMGIDHPDVRLVIHYQIPANIESLYQEMGRAGRDTHEATCLVLYTKKDKGLRSYFIRESDASEDIIGRRWTALDTLIEFAEGGECRHSGILTYFKDTQRITKCGHCDICAPNSHRRIQRSIRTNQKELKKKSVSPEVGPFSREEEIRKMVLSEWRREFAKEKDMPAFMVFSNRTLQELVLKNPTTLNELQKIYGIGQVKADEFGKEVLEELKKCES